MYVSNSAKWNFLSQRFSSSPAKPLEQQFREKAGVNPKEQEVLKTN